jgi:serine protease Do
VDNPARGGYVEAVPSLNRAALAVALLCASLTGSAGTAWAEDGESVDPLDAARARVREIESGLVSALEKVRQSSVTVLIRRYPKGDAANPEGEPVLIGGGSGVIIKYRGKPWIITNHHVIDGAHLVSVVGLDGREHRVEVHDSIRRQDIALLSFKEKVSGIVPVQVKKESSRKLTEGTWVFATGNPFFLGADGRSVTTLGVVSGLERVLGGGYLYGRAIQHDAEVNKGNSGGPLWNVDGDLVGINGMIMVRERNPALAPISSGVSFAIPIDQVWSHLRTLVDKRKDAKAPFLGLATETTTDDKGRPAGAVVRKVLRGSPCGPSGGRSKFIQKGDVILSFSPKGKRYPIRTVGDLTNALMKTQPGVPVSIKCRRGRKTFTWKGKIGVSE